MVNMHAQQKSLQKATKSLHFCLSIIKYLYRRWRMPNQHHEDWYQEKMLSPQQMWNEIQAASAAGTYDTQEL